MRHMMKQTFAALLAVLLAVSGLAGCRYEPTSNSSQILDRASPIAQETAPAVTDADIGKAQTWGGSHNVVSVKHLFFSEQPDAAALQAARNHDVGVVINLREPSEMDWDEAAEAENLGMTYYNVPVAAEGSGLDQEAMQTISRLAQQHGDQKILLHCSSGNRAAAWLAVHLANDHGMTVEQSIALAQQAGLTKPNMETRVRNYLSNGVREKT